MSMSKYEYNIIKYVLLLMSYLSSKNTQLNDVLKRDTLLNVDHVIFTLDELLLNIKNVESDDKSNEIIKDAGEKMMLILSLITMSKYTADHLNKVTALFLMEMIKTCTYERDIYGDREPSVTKTLAISHVIRLFPTNSDAQQKLLNLLIDKNDAYLTPSRTKGYVEHPVTGIHMTKEFKHLSHITTYNYMGDYAILYIHYPIKQQYIDMNVTKKKEINYNTITPELIKISIDYVIYGSDKAYPYELISAICGNGAHYIAYSNAKSINRDEIISHNLATISDQHLHTFVKYDDSQVTFHTNRDINNIIYNGKMYPAILIYQKNKEPHKNINFIE